MICMKRGILVVHMVAYLNFHLVGENLIPRLVILYPISPTPNIFQNDLYEPT